MEKEEYERHYQDTWEDHLLLGVMTCGIYFIVLLGCIIYVWCRAFVRRFIKKMPDWSDF